MKALAMLFSIALLSTAVAQDAAPASSFGVPNQNWAEPSSASIDRAASLFRLAEIVM